MKAVLSLLCTFIVVTSIHLHGAEDLKFYSQCLQDKLAYDSFFKDKKDGVFVDIGAHDGVTYSNTYFFEQLGWKGLCVEPNPEIFKKLVAARKATCVQGCISNKDGEANFYQVKSFNGEHTEMLSGLVDSYHPYHLERAKRETKNGAGEIQQIKVKCYTLNNLLAANNMQHIDYMSIDTEGGELEILKSIDYDVFEIDVIVVENNYASPEFEKFMASKGYSKTIDERNPWDEFYIRKGFKK